MHFIKMKTHRQSHFFSLVARSLGSSVLLGGLLAACSVSSSSTVPKLPSNPNSGLNYANQDYVVTEGLAEIQGEQAYHYQVDFRLTDGDFSFVLIPYYIGNFLYYTNDWISRNNSIEVFAELYSDGATSFTTANFDFAANEDGSVGEPSRAGQSYFQNAYLAIDVNGDKETNEDEEIQVVGGTIILSGDAPNYTMSLDLQLTNGQPVKGSFQGDFLVVD